MREMKRFPGGRVDWIDTGYAYLTADQIREYMVRLASMLECIVTDEQMERAVCRALEGTLNPKQDVPSSPPVPDPSSGTEAARAVLKPPTPVPPQLQDYFAADRKGNIPTVAPAGAQLQFVDVIATTESVDRKHLKVTFKGGKANCFDRALWPHIVRHTGKIGVPLWIIEKGDYLNVVGVRG
jgi:hypothetical protein